RQTPQPMRPVMLSHDQLAFAVIKLYPDVVYGKDFWTAHPVETGSSEPLAEAQIIAWQPKAIPQPSLDVLRDTFAQHADEFNALYAKDEAQCARAERNARLAASDWTQLPDVPPATRQAWEPYR